MYMQRLIGKVLDEEELLEQIEKEEELALVNKSVNNSSGYTLGVNGGSKNPNRYDACCNMLHFTWMLYVSFFVGGCIVNITVCCQLVACWYEL